VKLSQAFSSQHGADYKPRRPHVLADKTNSRHLQQTYITRSKWAGGPYSQNPWAGPQAVCRDFLGFGQSFHTKTNVSLNFLSTSCIPHWRWHSSTINYNLRLSLHYLILARWSSGAGTPPRLFLLHFRLHPRSHQIPLRGLHRVRIDNGGSQRRSANQAHEATICR